MATFPREGLARISIADLGRGEVVLITATLARRGSDYQIHVGKGLLQGVETPRPGSGPPGTVATQLASSSSGTRLPTSRMASKPMVFMARAAAPTLAARAEPPVQNRVSPGFS